MLEQRVVYHSGACVQRHARWDSEQTGPSSELGSLLRCSGALRETSCRRRNVQLVNVADNFDIETESRKPRVGERHEIGGETEGGQVRATGRVTRRTSLET